MLKISFIGDISLNNQYINLSKEKINPFEEICKTTVSSDLVVGNLECLSKGEEGFNLLRPIKHYTTIETLYNLRNINAGLLTLAHNHVYDNLQDGFEKTIHFLKENQIAYTGAWLRNEEESHTFLFEKNGIKITFLNYVHPDTCPTLPPDSPVKVSLYDKEQIIKDLSTSKLEADFVILLLHWGGRLEGGVYPDRYQIHDARAFVKNGADLIIGHHSHTFQPYEIIEDKHVFYSLGDFCADNVYKGGRRFKVRSESGILTVSFEKTSYSIDVYPIRNDKLFIRHNPEFLNRIFYRNRVLGFIKLWPFWMIYYIWMKVIEPISYYFFGYNRSFFDKLKSLDFHKFTTFIKRIH